MNDKAMLALQLMRNMECDVVKSFGAAYDMPSTIDDPKSDERTALRCLKAAFDMVYAALARTKDEE